MIELIPTEEREQYPSDAGRWVAQVDEWVRGGLEEIADWIESAHEAEQYYGSQQQNADGRIRLTANFIRRSIDIILAEILEGKIVINPVGRHPRDFEFGKQLLQVLEWTRDEEENWEVEYERAITGCIHIGEWAVFEGWNQYAEGRMGLPIAFAVDPRFLLWDTQAKKPQRDDARWIIWLNYERIEELEQQYPQFRGRFKEETYDQYLPGTIRKRERLEKQKDPRVWVKRVWTKKHRFKQRYIYRISGELAYAQTEDGRIPLDESLYRQLTPEEKEQVVAERTPVTELWESVIIGDCLVEHHLSPFDQSKGGHGHYPFAFFSYELLLDQPRGVGEIYFLRDVQDVYNESISQLLEQLFLNNVGFWQVYQGALTPTEREKLTKIAVKHNQIIETRPGFPPPEHRGVNPAGLQVAASILPVLHRIADEISGVQQVSRGETPAYLQSGKAIRYLQTQASRVSLKIRRHIECGLRRATLLRLHNIAQFMRGPRCMQVTVPGRQKGKLLFMAHSEEEALVFFNLQRMVDAQGKVTYQTEEGEPAEILVLNDEVIEDTLFERIKLVLDTRHEMNRLERMDQAEMVLNIVGPAALPWAAQELDWNNRDVLLEAIEKRDTAMALLQQVEEFEKKTGFTITRAMEIITEAVTGGASSTLSGIEQPQAAPPAAFRGISHIAKRSALNS